MSNLQALKEQFIRPTEEVERMRADRNRQTTQFPKRDGYYWLRWPVSENRPDPTTGKAHAEIVQLESGVVTLIGTPNDYRPTMKDRQFTFFGPIEPPAEFE